VKFRRTKQEPLTWVCDASWVTQAPAEHRRLDVIELEPAGPRHPLDWFTEWPPRVDSMDPMWHSLLVRRGWRDENNHWVGPAKGRKGKGKGKGKHKGKGHPPNPYELLVQMPTTAARDSPISRLAEQLVCDSVEFDWNAPHTDRVWKARQGQVRLYKHRLFTQGEAMDY
jgi:hypothetical protein